MKGMMGKRCALVAMYMIITNIDDFSLSNKVGDKSRLLSASGTRQLGAV